MLEGSCKSDRRVRCGLTLLAAGAILDAVSQFGVKTHLQITLTALASAAFMTRGYGPFVLVRRRASAPEGGEAFASWTPRVTAFMVSGVLLTAEVARFVRRGSHSAFPVWLSDLFHEDNSTWIFNGISTSSGNGLTARALGSGGALLQATLNGTGVLIAWLQGVPAGSVGVAVTGVGFSYVLLVVICPLLVLPLAKAASIRTRSFVTTSAVLIALTLVLERFMREVRDIGHLSAGLTVLGLLYSVLVLTSESADCGTLRGKRFGLWAFSFSCLLWFPLRPLALVFAVWAQLDSRVNNNELPMKRPKVILSKMIDIVFFLAVAIRALPDVWAHLSPANSENTTALINAAGGTYESFDFFLLTAALFVGSVLLRTSLGTRRERGVLGLLTAYAIGIRFVDQLASDGFDYGSTKMLWIMVPTVIFLSAAILIRDLPIEIPATRSWSGGVLVLCLLLANSTSFYGTIRLLGPLMWSDVSSSFIELNYPSHEDDVTQWDEPGGLNLSAPPKDLPVVCVMVDERAERPIPLWEFEPYRCTRKMSEMSLEVLRNSSDNSESLERIWKGYALMQQPLISAVMSSVESSNDLSRDVLILGSSGEIVRHDRVVDVLAQIALSDPVSVEAVADFNGVLVDSIRFNVERMDLETGKVSLWADQKLERILLISDLGAESLQVDRTARSDVAELLGRSNLLSGVSFSHPSVNGSLRCVVLIDREGNGTLAWSEDGGCSL